MAALPMAEPPTAVPPMAMATTAPAMAVKQARVSRTAAPPVRTVAPKATGAIRAAAAVVAVAAATAGGNGRGGGGLAGPTAIFEIWASDATGTRTILKTSPDGMTCIMVVGDDWQDDAGEAIAAGTPV